MSRSVSQSSVGDMPPEHNELVALSEELEAAYSEYVEEHDRLWEEFKAALQRVCGYMYEGSLDQLTRLKFTREKRASLDSHIREAQEFVKRVSQFCGNYST